MIPRALRTTRVVLRLDGELHERLGWTAYAHGYADLEGATCIESATGALP
jgi:hypothetical protein